MPTIHLMLFLLTRMVSPLIKQATYSRRRISHVANNLTLAPVNAFVISYRQKWWHRLLHTMVGILWRWRGFTLTGDHAGVLSNMLLSIVHNRDELGKTVPRWCVERIRQELRDPQPGGRLNVIQRLSRELADPGPDQLTQDVVLFGQHLKHLTVNEFFSDLASEREVVGSIFRYAFQSSETR